MKEVLFAAALTFLITFGIGFLIVRHYYPAPHRRLVVNPAFKRIGPLRAQTSDGCPPGWRPFQEGWCEQSK